MTSHNESRDKLVLNVAGMSCQHCKMAIEKALTAIEGVSEAEASVEEGQVTVHFDPDKVTKDDFKEAIEEEGYQVQD